MPLQIAEFSDKISFYTMAAVDFFKCDWQASRHRGGGVDVVVVVVAAAAADSFGGFFLLLWA